MLFMLPTDDNPGVLTVNLAAELFQYYLFVVLIKIYAFGMLLYVVCLVQEIKSQNAFW